MNLYRIALTELGLEKGFLVSLAVPEPTNQYRAYSATLPRSTGGNKRLGYKNDTWQWLNITPTQANEIIQMVEDALSGNGVIYATLPRHNGENAGINWIDVYGIPQYPEITPSVEGANKQVIQSMTMIINDITVVNEVSTAVPS